ncbi:MAG: gamma-glutamylcyclotransferase [Acidobacteriota bacterium]|nr:gamma-glutamylcyclotransferase [Acidobacteriota bacterium]
MSPALFVYGTLRSEFHNRFARLLRSRSRLEGRSTVTGSIYRIGKYPALRCEPPGVVHGEVYWLEDPEEMLGILDRYEGEDFERIMIQTTGAYSGPAWIYRYKKEPPDTSLIASGDFCSL